MAFAKGHKKLGGRRKGSTNVATVEVKTALQAAFHGIGGVKAFTEWAADNRVEFYKLFAKMLPTEVKAEVTGGVRMVIVEELTDAPEETNGT